MAALAQPAVSADSVITEATAGILSDKEAKAPGGEGRDLIKTEVKPGGQ